MTSQAAIRGLIASATADLQPTSPTPHLDAEVLLSHVSGLTKADFIVRPDHELPKDQVALFNALVSRRKLHEPVAYLVGSKEFYGLKFTVSPDVLIPRPETELLVELGLKHLATLSEPLSILDLGTGSGCIVIALAHDLKKQGKSFSALAIDKSQDALSIAQQNARDLKVRDAICFKQGNWFTGIPRDESTFDLIVSNPPYVAETDSERSPETNFEPAHALFSAEAGLADIKLLLELAPAYLSPRGKVLIEIGSSQAGIVGKHPARTFHIHHDLAQLPRVIEFS